MKVVIIDDEPGAIEALRSMVERYGRGFHVVGAARTALDGIKLIQRERPGLVLLDIEMPHGSGFDLLEAFPEREFQLIYTTAHEKHAVTAAHTHPFDYLLKPVDPDDLSRALEHLQREVRGADAERVEVSSLHGRVYIPITEILRVEAAGGYSTLHTRNGERHVASKSIGHYEELLPKDRFFRCHNSHLVCIPMVAGYLNQDGGLLRMVDGALVPIATRRYTEFLVRNKVVS